MPILKSSPRELAIHGGGPPAFESKVSAFSANAGDGRRFAEFAERMFLADEAPGKMVGEFESVLADWLDVRNVIGFSSRCAATRCLSSAFELSGTALVAGFGLETFSPGETSIFAIDSEPQRFGMNVGELSRHIGDEVSAVFAVHALGRACHVQALEDLCDEWVVPIFFYGHQGLGARYEGERLGSFGRAEVFDLGRDQLIHALDACVVTTDDDLLGHRLRGMRLNRFDGTDQSMSDAAAAMGLANIESTDAFVEANRKRFLAYSQLLAQIPGVSLVQADADGTYQCVAVEIRAGDAGLTRDSMRDVLAAENVGTAKPLAGSIHASASVAARLSHSLLQLPSGPSATDEVIEAVCKLVELAIVRSLESPDPMRLAA